MQREPVLVGTINIDSSEEISALLKKRGIPHNVLNAKFHEKEAEIVALAASSSLISVPRPAILVAIVTAPC